MANVYVRSGAAGLNDGSTKTDAYTTLSAALAAKSAGDDFWVASDHAESTAGAVTLASPGTETSPCKITCVDFAGSTPPVSANIRATATITCTGNNSITITGTADWEGLTITAGATTDNASMTVGGAATRSQWFNNCLLALGGSNAAGRLNLGNAGGNAQLIYLNNTSLSFASTSHKVIVKGKVIWENTSPVLTGLRGTIPTVLFAPAATYAADMRITGVDLSSAGSGKTLVDQSIDAVALFNFTDCKLGSSVTIGSENGTGFGTAVVRAVNCDSGDTHYRYYLSCFEGTVKSEATIVKTSGSSDGATTISRKMVSGPSTRFYAPLKSDWIFFWDDSPGSKTASLAVVSDGVTYKDNELWIEAEYLGASGFPLGKFASDAAADVLNAGTNQTTDGSSTWTTTGFGGTPVKQTLSTTFTTAEAGLYRVRACLAKASSTAYVDLKLGSSSRQFATGESGYLNQESGSGGAVYHGAMNGGLLS